MGPLHSGQSGRVLIKGCENVSVSRLPPPFGKRPRKSSYAEAAPAIFRPFGKVGVTAASPSLQQQSCVKSVRLPAAMRQSDKVTMCRFTSSGVAMPAVECR